MPIDQDLIVTLLRGHTDRKEEAQVLELLRQASAPTLDQVLREVDAAGLFRSIDDHWFGPQHRTELRELLTERLGELSIEAHRNVLTVKGEKTEEKTQSGEFLHRGIAARAFERRFQLADHVEVNGAELKNGLLHIDLKRNIPEEMKPRRITIAAGPAEANAKQIEAKAAH